MDKNLLRKAAFQSVALMLCVLMFSYIIKQYNSVTISASYSRDEVSYNKSGMDTGSNDSDRGDASRLSHDNQTDYKSDNPAVAYEGAESKDIISQLGDQYLIIKKPKGRDLKVQLEDIYITRQIKLVISGSTDEIPDNNFIKRVYKDEVFVGEPKYVEVENIVQEPDGTYTSVIVNDYGNDPVNSISIASSLNQSGKNIYEILLQLNHVYVHILYEDENYYYIDLKRPKDVYDKVIVIDAGHGGKDPGAISKDGEIYEKNINLMILNELKELLDKDDIKVYYTRTIDETLFLRPRVTLANEVECDFFISIHCNANDHTGPNGTEVLYYNHENDNVNSKDLAKILSEELAGAVSLKNGGILQKKGNEIFILANAKVPAVLVETGYLTNSGDLNYLNSKTGQQNIARGIYNGILQAYNKLMNNQN